MAWVEWENSAFQPQLCPSPANRTSALLLSDTGVGAVPLGMTALSGGGIPSSLELVGEEESFCTETLQWLRTWGTGAGGRGEGQPDIVFNVTVLVERSAL